jgi:hypothetical protein
MVRKISTLLILTLLLTLQAHAGESEFPLFKLGAGARAVGMGAAYTGVADDATAIFWNPAGMSQIKSRFSLEFSNRLHFQSSKFLELYGVYSDIKYGAFGVGFLSDQTSDILAYDANFNYLDNFSAYQRAFIVGYAYSLTPINIGLSLTSVQAGLDPPQGKVSGSGMTVTLGLLTRVTNYFKIGSTIRPGFSTKYDNSKDDIPGNARLGFEISARTGLTSPNDSLRYVLDLDQSNKLPLRINTGIEMTLFNILAVRGGLNSLYFETRTGNIKLSDLISSDIKYCLGLGLHIPSSNAGSFNLDGGFMSTRVGNSTSISISWVK